MSPRRRLLIALGASALAAPLGVRAQQGAKIWRVGILVLSRRPASLESDFLGAFPVGMRELGYVEGKNLLLEWRFADGKVERLSDLAAELVRLKVDLILAAGTPTISAVQKATARIPIVMGVSNDPVGSGFVKSLARPGGNITGLSNLAGDIGPKHLEMLLSVVPKLSRVAVLVNPANVSHAGILKSIQASAGKASVSIQSAEAKASQEIEGAFSVFERERAEVVIVAPDPVFTQYRLQIAELAAKYRLPSIYTLREYAEVGGLMSYGQNLADSYRRAAAYADKIFKGANPGDLPVEQSTKLEMFINRRTAKILGLAIPADLLLRADRVIE